MKLLKLLHKSSKPSHPKENVFFEQRFTQSHTFRGYKRFHVTYYGYGPAESGLAAFRETGMDLEGAEIILRGVERNDYKFIDVIVNGFFIGSIPFWSLDNDSEASDFIKKGLLKGKVEKAHIRIESENIISSDGVTAREKISIFLKAAI